MITDQIRSINELAEGIERKDKEDSDQNSWNTYRRDVDKIITDLSEPMLFEGWLMKMDPTYVKPSVKGANRAAVAAKTLLEVLESREATATGEQLVKLENLCKGVRLSQEETSAKGWKKLKDDVAWGNSHIYAAFKGHETHGIHFEELVQAEQIFRQQLEPQPYLSQKEDQELFEHVLNIRNQLLKKLPKMDNLEVEEFLKNAANDGAKLGSLTDNVKDWLRNNKLGAKYVIKQR